MSNNVLFLQIGGVHSLISQARSTRDLWAGSYLIAWHATRLVQELEKEHKATFLFPTFEGNEHFDQHPLPLLHWLKRNDADRKEDNQREQSVRRALIPRISNRIVASINESPETISETIYSIFGDPKKPQKNCEWHQIANSVQEWLANFAKEIDVEFSSEWDARFLHQIHNFWDLSWLFTEAENIKNIQSYGTVSKDFDATRSLRLFHALPPLTDNLSREKDALTGREEALLTDSFFRKFRDPEGQLLESQKENQAAITLNHLFRPVSYTHLTLPTIRLV